MDDAPPPPPPPPYAETQRRLRAARAWLELPSEERNPEDLVALLQLEPEPEALPESDAAPSA